METEHFFYLGKILKTFGNCGDVIVHLEVDNPGHYKNLESVFLDLHGERVPFFIASIAIRQNGKAVIRFLDFETAGDAESLAGLEMYLPASQLPRLKGNKFYFHEVTGFRVTDKSKGDIGVIEGILDLPLQAVLRIRNGEKEILVPAVDEIIRKVDRKQQTILIEAPEGLIDLYL